MQRYKEQTLGGKYEHSSEYTSSKKSNTRLNQFGLQLPGSQESRTCCFWLGIGTNSILAPGGLEIEVQALSILRLLISLIHDILGIIPSTITLNSTAS